tara:strand:+ start:736 stop:2079 length:1344 start_codon:yes stop_codon:yes gene_type:complete
MASTYLSKTFGTDHSSVYKWTYSFWMKRGLISVTGATIEELPVCAYTDNNTLGIIRINTDNTLEIYDYQSGFKLRKITSRKFTDNNGWFHIVVSSDNSVGSPVFKLFINGVQETRFSTNTDYTQNQATMFNKNVLNEIGRNSNGSGYFSGSISHFHFIDGTIYDADVFGSTDATTGEWKINPSPSVTYGTNGFFVLKDGNSGTDQSPNSNNHTISGTLTKTEDNPSNVFATLNPLQLYGTPITFSNGNTTAARTGSWKGNMATLGAYKGKFYYECKKVSGNMALGMAKFGWNVDNSKYLSEDTSWLGDKEGAWIFYNNGSGYVKYGNAVSGGNWGSAPSNGDILMCAMDLDNGTIWIGKNGTWFNSATNTEIANGTTTNAMYSGIATDAPFTPLYSVENGNLEFNFGNGYFGTTAVSSAGTNASNIGIFEYDVPTGFTALSTKGLNL